jgi:hypothetical protein
MTTILSGTTTVTTAGEAVKLSTLNVNKPVAIKAMATNSGVMYVGNDGSNDVSLTTGFPLEGGEAVVLGYVGDLESIYIDSQYNGEGVAWLVLEK